MMIQRALLAAVSAATASMLVSAAASAAPVLKGSWAAVTVGGKPMSGATLDISDAKVSGKSVCNGYRGAIAVTETTIKIGPLVSTRMMCTGQMDAEATYLKALQSAASYKLTADTLELTGADGATLATFKR
ncbi:MAG: META domain-containing protein [Hyphomicrobium sp.]|nr:META domain-containing protein [Hyphomicrobium sp.]